MQKTLHTKSSRKPAGRQSNPGASRSEISRWSSIINPTANKADREYVEAVNKCWTGIKEPHFRRCAVQARGNNLPGGTVLPEGHVLAEIVLQCVKRGLVNHLILDSDCANELHKMAR